jgi:hypothetical protein
VAHGAKVTLAPVVGPANVTEAPVTSLPEESVTSVTNTLLNAVLNVADWAEPETTAMVLAGPAVIDTPLDDGEVVSPDRVPVNVYVPAAAVLLTWQFANWATPAVAVTVVLVHESVPCALPPLPAT